MDPGPHLAPAEALLEPGSAGEARARAAHLTSCASCAAAVAADREAAAQLPLALAPVEPGPDLWKRVEAELGGRLGRFADRCAALLDVAVERARALLDAVDGSEGWEDGLPGISIFHLEGGPAVAGAITGFVRLAPGTVFAEHVHLGAELNLVLQGAVRSSDGREARAGEELAMEAGSRHSLLALPGPPLVYLGVSLQGIEMAGEAIGADDPRA